MKNKWLLSLTVLSILGALTEARAETCLEHFKKHPSLSLMISGKNNVVYLFEAVEFLKNNPHATGKKLRTHNSHFNYFFKKARKAASPVQLDKMQVLNTLSQLNQDGRNNRLCTLTLFKTATDLAEQFFLYPDYSYQNRIRKKHPNSHTDVTSFEFFFYSANQPPQEPKAQPTRKPKKAAQDVALGPESDEETAESTSLDSLQSLDDL